MSDPATHERMKLRDYLSQTGTPVAIFAAKIGVDRTVVYRYLRLGRIPHRDVMLRIIEHTGGKVTASDFYEAHT